MPATQTPDYTKLAAWLNGAGAASGTGTRKKADLPEKEDDGKPATEGARSSENARDAKQVVGGDAAEGGAKNPADGRSDNQASYTNLESGTSDKGPPDGAKPTKTIEEESAKVSAADLGDPTQLDAAMDALRKAAAELPVLLATAGVPAPKSAAQNAAAPAQVPADRPIGQLDKAAADRALAATVGSYRKYGSDYGEVTVSFLRGHWDMFNTLKQAADDGTLAQMLAGGGGGDPAADPAAAAAMGGAGGGAGPDAAAMGGAGGDAPPGGAGGGEPGVDDHAAAAAELGLSPQELEQLIAILQAKLQEAQAGGGAGGEPAMTPDQKAAVDRALTKAAAVVAAVKDHVRSGKFQFKPAADGTADRKHRNAARAYFEELRRAAG